MDFVQVSIKGELFDRPSARVDGHTIFVPPGWLRIATVYDEDWQPFELDNPTAIVSGLKAGLLKSDLFTFGQKLPQTQPKHAYPFVWDNIAAIPLTTFAEWWEKKISQETRRNVRLATKRGLALREVDFNDELAHGIKQIYDETPYRNGREFWHYGKAFEAVKRENATYLDKSQFIGAYFGSELVGFLKMVQVNNFASIMQIIAKNKHQERRPMNALIAKAVELCCDRELSHLVYCKYTYGKNEQSSLTEFKRRSGFEKILVPKYYVPVTVKGRIAMGLRLHLGLKEALPKWLTEHLIRLRAAYYQRLASFRTPRENCVRSL